MSNHEQERDEADERLAGLLMQSFERPGNDEPAARAPETLKEDLKKMESIHAIPGKSFTGAEQQAWGNRPVGSIPSWMRIAAMFLFWVSVCGIIAYTVNDQYGPFWIPEGEGQVAAPGGPRDAEAPKGKAHGSEVTPITGDDKKKGGSDEEKARKEKEAKIRATKLQEVDFADADIEWVLNTLRQLTGVNIMTDPEAIKGRKCSIQGKNLALGSVLDFIEASCEGVNCRVVGDAIWVTAKKTDTPSDPVAAPLDLTPANLADSLRSWLTSINATAKVLAVKHDKNLIMLSAGSAQGVRPGLRFTISRGDRYIGKAVVTKVYPDMCSAEMVPKLTAIGKVVQKGDKAETRTSTVEAPGFFSELIKAKRAKDRLRVAQAKLDASRAVVSASEKYLEEAKEAFKAGTGTAREVKKAEVDLARAKAELIEAEAVTKQIQTAEASAAEKMKELEKRLQDLRRALEEQRRKANNPTPPAVLPAPVPPPPSGSGVSCPDAPKAPARTTPRVSEPEPVRR